MPEKFQRDALIFGFRKREPFDGVSSPRWNGFDLAHIEGHLRRANLTLFQRKPNIILILIIMMIWAVRYIQTHQEKVDGVQRSYKWLKIQLQRNGGRKEKKEKRKKQDKKWMNEKYCVQMFVQTMSVGMKNEMRYEKWITVSNMSR